ncbi:MAG TPA: site-2 protease family protein [bacterium]|nr:site-2 protease family protein [bacterium]
MDLELMWRVEELRRLAATEFMVGEVVLDGAAPTFTVIPTADMRARFLALRTRAAALGYLPLLRRRGGRTVLAFIPRPPAEPWRWGVNLVLFLATLGTTFLAGYLQSAGLSEFGFPGSAVGSGLAFSLSLMAILVTHEMGHKVAAVLRGVDSSLPYFIPMLPPIGTMGAVIITRTPSPNRDALMDVAAAGPIAGFLAAIPVLLLGVSRSLVIDPRGFQGISYPDPLILQWLVQAILHPPEGMVVLGHPILFAGWIGLLVTSLNLLPAGMLDGGHVVRALFGPRIHTVTSWLAAAIAAYFGYWLMALLILMLIRRGHPGPLDDVSPPSPSRIVVGVLLLAIFVLSAVPLRIAVLP